MTCSPEFEDSTEATFAPTADQGAPGALCFLTNEALSRTISIVATAEGLGHMNRRVGELALLTVLSAVICGIAFTFDYVVATAVFAVITCTIGVLAVSLKNFW